MGATALLADERGGPASEGDGMKIEIDWIRLDGPIGLPHMGIPKGMQVRVFCDGEEIDRGVLCSASAGRHGRGRIERYVTDRKGNIKLTSERMLMREWIEGDVEILCEVPE